MDEIRTVKLGAEEVKLDPSVFVFNETTLNSYLEAEAGWYAYFGSKLADAEYLQHSAEADHDKTYSERFKEARDGGLSEKTAEAATKSDSDVEEAKQCALAAKHKVRLLQNFMRAFDRAHENAQSRGHFLRKEMDQYMRDLASGAA